MFLLESSKNSWCLLVRLGRLGRLGLVRVGVGVVLSVDDFSDQLDRSYSNPIYRGHVLFMYP